MRFALFCRLACLLVCGTILSGCKDELYSGLSQREANEMIAALHEAKIDATREAKGEGYSVLVARDDFGSSVTVLSALGLPKNDYRSIDQIFPGDRMILTPFEQKIRMKYALDQELSKTISSLDGILEANVMVVLPEVDFRGKATTKTSASVLVRSVPGADLAGIVSQIRMLIANAVPGISYEDVAVVHADLTPGDEG